VRGDNTEDCRQAIGYLTMEIDQRLGIVHPPPPPGFRHARL
jgi:hypothetical protein